MKFNVYEPKKREIKCLHYKDRVVQRSLCDNVIKPYFKDRLIYDNCTCQNGKGTHFGLYRVCDFMKEHYDRHGVNGYVLKGNIKKYFYSIDCGILKEMVLPKVKDEKIKALLTHIIDSPHREETRRLEEPVSQSETAEASDKGTGIPLGNQTSQWFALIYLDPLDRLVKEKLRIKHYSRYMDDFVLIHNSKSTCKNAWWKSRRWWKVWA